MEILNKIVWNKDQLISAIIQDADTKKVLMMAWMNEESLKKTISEGKCYFWSRSRNKLWLKGEESGHIHFVKEILLDCDNDCLLLMVKTEEGISCHTGRESCFFKQIKKNGDTMNEIEAVKISPERIYKEKK